MTSKLSGKTALVTGASRGIGRAIALSLAGQGVQVLAHFHRAEAEAEALVREIQVAGGKAQKVRADLRQPDGPHRLAQAVRTIIGCRLDILVANAGASYAGSMQDTTVEAFDELFALNVRAAYFLTQQLLPVMCKGSNVILMSAHADAGQLPAYAASKGAVETLARHFAVALGERGIRVNVVSTAATQAFKRPAEPEDIANAVTFLASDQARWVTGNTLHVDGGSRL